MHQYIADTKYAIGSLFDALTHDRPLLEALEAAQQDALSKEAYFDIAFLQRQMHPSANFWYGQLREASAERNALDVKVAELQAQILDLRFSLAALAGAVLQIAKQGISIVRGRPDNCPDGRLVRGAALKNIIWAGRNQSQHFELPRMVDDWTCTLLSSLADNGADSSLRDARGETNLAFAVLEVLGWSGYDAYEQDMVSLLG